MKVDRTKPKVSNKGTRKALLQTSPSLQRRDVSPQQVALTSEGEAAPHWTFLTNHSHVLVALAQNPTIVLREVARQVKITERAVQRIIADLEAGGFIEREKVGRQNHYRIRVDRPLRHEIESHRTIGDLLSLIIEPGL